MRTVLPLRILKHKFSKQLKTELLEIRMFLGIISTGHGLSEEYLADCIKIFKWLYLLFQKIISGRYNFVSTPR